jgi:hypothetical protein
MLLGSGVSLGSEWTISSWFKDLDGPILERVLGETSQFDSPVTIPSGSAALGAYIDPANYPCGYSLLPSTGEWHCVTAVGDAAGIRYFIDGEEVGSITNRVGGTLRSVGNRGTGGGVSRFARYIDEFRVSNVARSTNWIAAGWLNLASNGSFVTYGAAERQRPSGEPDPDSDSDGMPDAWEITHFGSTAAEPDEDADGDWLSNFGEYVAGTDPTNEASVFCVLDIGSGWLTLSAVSGHQYRVNSAATPVGPWTNLSGWMSWTGATMRLPLPADPAAYRPSVRQQE